MNIVITMAGLGSRFQKVGYKVPKYMIEAKSKTLFEWSMISLLDFITPENKFIFILREEDQSDDFISEACSRLNIDKFDLIKINYLTDGQATTAYLAKDKWEADQELLIYNIDTYVEAYEMKRGQIQGDGFIPCFVAEGDHWSFAKTDENGDVLEVREKKRISDYCTLGAYYFRSCNLYETLYTEYYGDGSQLEKNEKYIAPLYNHLIKKGGKVNISIVPYEKVHVLGTPEELQAFML